MLCITGPLINAQSKCNINKAWAFYTSFYPGVQMADEHGNPIPPKPIIERFIYIEWCGSKKPEIKEVVYNNVHFTAVLEKVDGKWVIPGKDLSRENKTRITAAKCKKLWKIALYEKEGEQVPEPGCKSIIIKIMTPGICTYKLTKETPLHTLPRP